MQIEETRENENYQYIESIQVELDSMDNLRTQESEMDTIYVVKVKESVRGGWKAISYHKTESGAKIQRDFNKEYTMYEESEYRVFTEVLQD